MRPRTKRKTVVYRFSWRSAHAPSSANRVPKYRKHASGQGVVHLGGKDIYLGVHGTKASKWEYDRLIAEWIAGGRQFAPAKAETDLTFNELCLAYLKYAQSYYIKDGKPTAEVDCIRSAIRPLTQLYGHTLVSEFGPLAAKAVREEMIRRDYSRGFANRCMGRLKRLLRWGVENELVPATVYHGVKEVAGLRAGRTGARETPGRHPVSQEHIDAVCKVVRQKTRDLIDLMLLTAARPGELLSLTTGMIDRTGQTWFARLTNHKTTHQGKERVLYFGPGAQLILRRYLKPHAPAVRLWSQKSFRNAIINACKRASVPRWTPHWLRHTALTRIREEFGAEAAQVIAGHQHLSTTELYAQKSFKRAVEVMQKVG